MKRLFIGIIFKLFKAFGWIIATALSLETILGNAMVVLAYHLERSISKQVTNTIK
jgi:hypothetical protein